MFQQVKNILGQMDGQYQAKLEVHATIRQVKKLEYSQNNGKPKQGLLLQDQHGEQEWVNLIGKFDPLDDSYVGRAFQFLVWPYQAPQSPNITLYCWLQKASNMPQTPPQSAPQPRQVTNNGRDATGTSIERQCVIKAVGEIAAARPDMTAPDCLWWANQFHKWIATGEFRNEQDSNAPFPDDEPEF